MYREKISVIIPVYKTEKYLNECVDSVIHQTYKNLEIILVDDGSPDNCPRMCDEYAEKDERIKVIHKENGGPASARNAGLDTMSGDYVTFIDSDDYIDFGMVERMLSIASENGAEVVQISFERDPEVFRSKMRCATECTTILAEDNIKNFALDRILRPEACGKLYRSELFCDMRFNESVKYAEDLEFGLKFYKKVKKSLVCNEKLYFYRENSNSLTGSSLSVGRLYEPEMLRQAVEDEKCNWLRECIVFRYIRCAFAVLNRVVTENRADLYDGLRSMILKYGNKIFSNQYLGAKYKLGFVLLVCCKTFKPYSFLIKRTF